MATATISFKQPDYSVTASVYRDGGLWAAAWAGLIGRGKTVEGAIADLRVHIQTTSAEAAVNDLEK